MGGDVQGGSSITQQSSRRARTEGRSARDPIERDAAYREGDRNHSGAQDRRDAPRDRPREGVPENDILLGYLNIALFGGTVYGIEAAARLLRHQRKGSLAAQSAALWSAIVNNPEKFRFDRRPQPSQQIAGAERLPTDPRPTATTSSARMDLESEGDSRARAQAAAAEPLPPRLPSPAPAARRPEPRPSSATTSPG
ncbi:transglycosylase domain-containing protein [Rathayibacter iranicus]